MANKMMFTEETLQMMTAGELDGARATLYAMINSLQSEIRAVDDEMRARDALSAKLAEI